jgi:hypothetical protein
MIFNETRVKQFQPVQFDEVDNNGGFLIPTINIAANQIRNNPK